MVKYSIAMGIRMLCIIALLFSQGWWVLVFGIGAMVLPYIAVVIANVGPAGEGGAPDRPGGLVRIERDADGTSRASTAAADAPLNEQEPPEEQR